MKWMSSCNVIYGSVDRTTSGSTCSGTGQRPDSHTLASVAAEWRSFTIHLDRIFRARQRVDEFAKVLDPVDRVREQLLEPAGEIGFRKSHVFDATFEVLTVGIDGANHHLVADPELEVDLVGRDRVAALAAGHARQHQHTVLRQCPHAVED